MIASANPSVRFTIDLNCQVASAKVRLHLKYQADYVKYTKFYYWSINKDILSKIFVKLLVFYGETYAEKAFRKGNKMVRVNTLEIKKSFAWIR